MEILPPDTDEPIRNPVGDAWAHLRGGQRFGFGEGKNNASEAGRKSGEARRKRKEIREKLKDLIGEGFPISSLDDLKAKMQECMSKGDLQGALALRLLGFGLGGSIEDLKEVIAQNEGHLASKTQLGGDPENPLTINHVYLSDEERDQRVIQLLNTARARRDAQYLGPVEAAGRPADAGPGEQG